MPVRLYVFGLVAAGMLALAALALALLGGVALGRGLGGLAGGLLAGLLRLAENMDAVEEVLERKAECILCMDDAVCSRVLKKLREKNVKVPKDIRVASFYNSSVLENNVPSITSLSFDAKELGMVACKTVLDVIEGAEVETRTLLPYEVVLKESTK